MDGLARQCPRPRSKSNTRRPQQSSTVCSDRPKSDCTACGTLHQVGECPAASVVCFKCNKQGHYSRLCRSKSQSTTTSTPNSNRNTMESWDSRGRGGRGCGSRCAVYEAETTDTSKTIVDATNSEVDIVKLLQAYGMVPTEGSEFKHRRKKVATDEISIVPIQTLGANFTFEPKTLVLRGSPVECNIDVQWELCENIVSINTYIATLTVPIEVANPLDWSFDVYLTEIDLHTDVVHSNIELNRIVLKAKQDTGAQINVLSKSVFQTLQKKSGKLPLYPKTCVKLVRYGNKTINYLVTTKIKCNHNGTEIDAVFYITDVSDTN